MQTEPVVLGPRVHGLAPPIQQLYSELPLRAQNAEIRLITIEPAADDLQPIRCRLFTANLANHNGYTALSYIWGSLDDGCAVFVNGLDFWVTKNLDFALRSLRRHRPGCAFWVDAICINQHPDAVREREDQVKIMDQIYESAAQVIACVGPAPEGDADMIASIDTTAVLRPENLANSINSSRHEFEHFSRAILTEPVRQVINRLFQQPYWTRTWTLQEIALASDVVIIYGHKVITWGTLEGIIFFLDIYCGSGLGFIRSDGPHNATFVDMRYGFGVRRLRQALSKPTTIPLLNLSSHCQEEGMDPFLINAWGDFSAYEATDPRDKIYGFLGIAKRLAGIPDAILRLPIDYSTSFRDLYRRFAELYIASESSLDITLCAGCCQRPSPDIPSWVPDWRAEMRTRVNAKMGLRTQLYKACLGQSYIPTPVQGGMLLANGVLCDTVTVFQREGSLLHFEQLLLTYAPPFTPTGIPSLQALMRALVLDRTRDIPGHGRLLDNDQWLFWFVLGFCIFLGTKVGSGPIELRELGEGLASDEDLVLSRRSWFIQKYLRWMSRAVEYLDTMLDGGSPLPPAAEDGSVTPRSLRELPPVAREPTMGAAAAAPPPPAAAAAAGARVSNKHFMECHRASFRKALQATDIESILAPLLGYQEGSETSITREMGDGGPRIADSVEKMANMYKSCYRQFLLQSAVTNLHALFVTSEGYIGIAPAAIASGDVVCVLQGLSVPVILRRVNESYKLIGACFVQDLMDGLAMEWVEKGLADLTTFPIS